VLVALSQDQRSKTLISRKLSWMKP
jgi:hypothetical protein